MAYEYKVVPAPVKGLKARGVKSGADRFANALETTMNDLAADGWEYQRTDTLPCEEREGLMGKTTVFQNMLVFRRAVVAESAEVPTEEPKALPAPVAEDPHVLSEKITDGDDVPSVTTAPDAPKPATNDAETQRVAAE